MEEIKVGEYVRTDNGEIHKVEDIEDLRIHIKTEKIMFRSWVDDYYGAHKEDRFMVKHSPSIIDLIEIKDLIKFRNKLPNSLEDEEMIIHIFDNDTLEEIKQAVEREEIEILSIVTKEQFSNIEYRLED